jgi:CO/xanthine dehydrogenase FAD-binding subunit
VDAAQRAIEPRGDIHASAAFRTHLIGVLGQQVLETAFVRAQGRSA